MKSGLRLTLSVFLGLVTPAALRAALPSDAIVLEAENMEIVGEGWEVRENFKDWFKGWTTGNKCLYGAKAGGGYATAELEAPADGEYRIWVRYLDLRENIRKENNSFILETFPEAGIDIPAAVKSSRKEFDAVGLRATDEGLRKWGDSYSAFVWDWMDARLSKGKFTLRLSKSHPNRSQSLQRVVDCIIITSDPDYEAQTEDLTPLYVRFDVPADRTDDLRFLLYARCEDGRYFHEHRSFQTPFVTPVKPGASSQWIELSRYLSFGQPGRYNRVTFGSFVHERGEVLDSDYTVNFATEPSENAIVKTFKRHGGGGSMSFRIDLQNRDDIISETEDSAANLARSKATEAVGRYPRKFTFQTSCYIAGALDQTRQNELQALRNIGINRMSYPPHVAADFAEKGIDETRVSFYTWNLRGTPTNSAAGPCYLSPRRDEIERSIRKAEETAQSYPPETRVIRLAGLADEPGFDYLAHVPACPLCRQKFPEYLRQQGLVYDVFADEAARMAQARRAAGETVDMAARLDTVLPSADTNYPRHFYWTSRFGINTVTEFIRFATTTAENLNPEWRVTLNFANQLRSTMAGGGVDWFEIFRTKAMTLGMNEDYIAWIKNFQPRGYLMAVMRAACREPGYDYGPLVAYPGKTGWEVISGGFSQIGQGAKFMDFFNYGPHYVPCASPCSEIQWVHDSTRYLTYATGAVEDHLLKAKVMRSDVATLLSNTSDIWNVDIGDSSQTFNNLYGMERFYLYLVLRHLQFSVDVLSEEDLGSELKHYRVLLATDSHLRREFVPAIRDWIAAGGTLYVGANALSRDEYNQPLELFDGMGLERHPLVADGKLIPKRPRYELRHRRSLATVLTPEPFDAIFGVQPLAGGATLYELATEEGETAPALTEVEYGKGRVVAAATFPAMDYIKTSDWDEALDIKSTVIFSSGPRDFIGKAVERSGIKPRACCDNMFLEANLLEDGKTIIVALANWSGREQESTIRFNNLGGIESVTALRSNIEVIKNESDQLTIKGKFGPGDYLTIQKKWEN